LTRQGHEGAMGEATEARSCGARTKVPAVLPADEIMGLERQEDVAHRALGCADPPGQIGDARGFTVAQLGQQPSGLVYRGNVPVRRRGRHPYGSGYAVSSTARQMTVAHQAGRRATVGPPVHWHLDLRG